MKKAIHLIAGLVLIAASQNLYANDAKLSTIVAEAAERADKAAGEAVAQIPAVIDGAAKTAAIKADQFAFFFVLRDKELSDAVFMRQ